MSTTLLNALIEFSKQTNDYWDSTTTSAGAAGGTTVVDTALKVNANDWVSLNTWDLITSGTYNTEERHASTLDNSTGTMTVLAHTGQIASGVTYQVHRLASASDKRRALIYAARHGFPYIYTPIWNESIVNGDWLKDGSFEKWTNSTTPTYWTVTTVTVTQTTTSWAFLHGATSAKLSTAAGRISQGISEYADIKYLAGKAVTFTVQGHCDTASCLRIGIYDGDTTTYSDYHDGDSAWTDVDDPLTVTATIPEDADSISFRIFHDVAAGVSYVDDARVISGDRSRLYIGHLGLGQNRPHQVLIEPSNYSQHNEWTPIRDWQVDQDGYLYVPSSYPTDKRLRIRGMGYLDFLASGVSSTAWTATIALDSPQLDILIAEAAVYLCNQKIMPIDSSGDTTRWKEAHDFWIGQLEERRRKYKMMPLPIFASYGVR